MVNMELDSTYSDLRRNFATIRVFSFNNCKLLFCCYLAYSDFALRRKYATSSRLSNFGGIFVGLARYQIVFSLALHCKRACKVSRPSQAVSFRRCIQIGGDLNESLPFLQCVILTVRWLLKSSHRIVERHLRLVWITVTTIVQVLRMNSKD